MSTVYDSIYRLCNIFLLDVGYLHNFVIILIAAIIAIIIIIIIISNVVIRRNRHNIDGPVAVGNLAKVTLIVGYLRWQKISV